MGCDPRELGLPLQGSKTADGATRTGRPPLRHGPRITPRLQGVLALERPWRVPHPDRRRRHSEVSTEVARTVAPPEGSHRAVDREDTLLNTWDRKERLSVAYVEAVAACAGYVVAPGPPPDRDSIDLQIRAGGRFRPALHLQLKATSGLGDPVDGVFRFRLKRKNYDDLRIETQTPRVLVVLALPRDEARWLTVRPSKMVIRRCAYWVRLHGLAETTNRTTVTVDIPQLNVFDPDALHSLMEWSRSRGRP